MAHLLHYILQVLNCMITYNLKADTPSLAFFSSASGNVQHCSLSDKMNIRKKYTICISWCEFNALLRCHEEWVSPCCELNNDETIA